MGVSKKAKLNLHVHNKVSLKIMYKKYLIIFTLNKVMHAQLIDQLTSRGQFERKS
jgi:hypothetical protein